MLLVVAWDGACFDVLDPLIADGVMPTLRALLERGAARALLSTTPAVTFPAWTSFATAASPVRHGVTDFTAREGYRLRLLNATHRALPSLWELASARGLRVGVYALPATYPPDPITGVMVCGFDTPLGAASLGGRTHPVGFGVQIESRYGNLAVVGPQQTRIGAGWHARARRHLLATLALRTRICADLLRESRFDCFVVHFSESDTVSHQFWDLCDPRSPRHRLRAGEAVGAIGEVYAALDRSLAELLDAAGADATIMLVSDHGSGGTGDRAVFWNRWLAEHGYLRFAPVGLGARVATNAKSLAMRSLPARWQSSLVAALPRVAAGLEARSRLGGIDWRNTRAFSEELNYFPSIWLNLAGREPQGPVAPGDRERLAEDLTRDLLAFRDPIDGGPVVARVRRRERFGDGPYSERIPDLVLELHEPDGYSYASLRSRTGRASIRRMSAAEMSGARGASMPGAHRNLGICVVAGESVLPGRYPVGSLPDAGATAMALIGCRPHPRADGRCWADCVAVAPPPMHTSTVPSRDRGPRGYGPHEEEEVADRLRALGYLA